VPTASLNAAKATLKIRKATLDQLKADLERIEGLYKKKLASDKELEAAKSSYLAGRGFL
jgi:multidrug resistance efflux pump